MSRRVQHLSFCIWNIAWFFLMFFCGYVSSYDGDGMPFHRKAEHLASMS